VLADGLHDHRLNGALVDQDRKGWRHLRAGPSTGTLGRRVAFLPDPEASGIRASRRLLGSVC
jgi:hypothetical protein